MRKLPDAGEGKRGEEGHIGYLLRQAATAFRNRVDRQLADTGLTHPQFAVLTMAQAYPGCSGADLARLALLTPQTVNVIVANLEKAGAIRRRPHATHGRIQQIELTPRGRSLLVAARQRVDLLERRLLAGVAPAEEVAVRAWLARVALPAEEGAAARRPGRG